MKKFVPVIAEFEEDGKIIPMKILWEDGREFDVDLTLISGQDRL